MASDDDEINKWAWHKLDPANLRCHDSRCFSEHTVAWLNIFSACRFKGEKCVACCQQTSVEILVNSKLLHVPLQPLQPAKCPLVLIDALLTDVLHYHTLWSNKLACQHFWRYCAVHHRPTSSCFFLCCHQLRDRNIGKVFIDYWICKDCHKPVWSTDRFFSGADAAAADARKRRSVSCHLHYP